MTETAEHETAEHVRLSVYLGTEPAAALRQLMASLGITATEAVRRAISVWKFVEDEQAKGHKLAVLADGAVREVTFEVPS